MNRTGATIGVGLIVVLVLIVLLAGQSRGGGPPLDPDSTDEFGTRALTELLGRFGSVRVIEGTPGPDNDTALLLTETGTDGGEGELRAWTEAGGRLVVFAGSSSIAAPAGGTFVGDLDRGTCDIEALDGVDELDLSGGTKLVVEEGDRSCFGDGRQAFVVASDRGKGTVVTVGSSTPFVNRSLDEADNSVLAVALLTPDGSTRAALVRPRSPFEGGESSLDLLGPAFDRSVWQAVIAFGVLAVATAVRFGRPVSESMPARIAGSELVAAVGGLMQDADEPADAAATLRAAARDELCRLCSIDLAAPNAVLAELISARTGRDADVVLTALDGPVRSAADLVRTARTLDDLRRDCRHVPGGTS